jgi:hypothetical protein
VTGDRTAARLFAELVKLAIGAARTNLAIISIRLGVGDDNVLGVAANESDQQQTQ